MERTIGFKERRYIEELRILTRATAIDCIIDERFERVIYVIKQGDMGFAIGKKGENIRRLQNVIGKKVEMVEYSPDIREFITHMFKPAQVTGIRESAVPGTVDVVVRQKGDLGLAIGRGGVTIEKARLLLRRFGGPEIGEVVVGEGESDSQ
ncbi:MAG: NusA-like transcription termination signal-binding factor [Methanolinea sp.]|nr:NusA-like transcription termination signal-binding factor [Methanolinea sp.]